MRKRKQQLSVLGIEDAELKSAVAKFDSALRETDSIIEEVDTDLRAILSSGSFPVSAIPLVISNSLYIDWENNRLYIYNEEEETYYYTALSS